MARAAGAPAAEVAEAGWLIAVLAACAVGLIATLYTGRAPAEGERQRALPPDLPEHPASTPDPSDKDLPEAVAAVATKPGLLSP